MKKRKMIRERREREGTEGRNKVTGRVYEGIGETK